MGGAQGLTIDGAIFVLFKNDVQKFIRGLKRDFTLESTTPPLQNLNYLYTENERDNLYLLSNLDRRIIIFDKQGKLLKQIYLPKLTNLSRWLVDSANQFIYLLDQNNIYQLKLSDYKM